MEQQRCAYSEEYKIRFRFSKNPNRKGYIVAVSRDGNCYYILWDSRTSNDCIHKDFIQIIPDDRDKQIDELKASEIF